MRGRHHLVVSTHAPGGRGEQAQSVTLAQTTAAYSTVARYSFASPRPNARTTSLSAIPSVPILALPTRDGGARSSYRMSIAANPPGHKSETGARGTGCRECCHSESARSRQDAPVGAPDHCCFVSLRFPSKQ